MQALEQEGPTQIGTNTGDRCGHANVSLACKFKAENLQYEQRLHLDECPELVIKNKFYFCTQNPNRTCNLLINPCVNDSIIE